MSGAGWCGARVVRIRNQAGTAAGAALALLASAALASAAQGVSLGFEASEGVPSGTGTVSVLGSTWTGGSAEITGTPLLYADGTQAYFIDPLFGSGSGQVVFDVPVVDLAFVFSWSEDLGIPFASGEYFDADGNSLGTFSAQVADGMDTEMTILPGAAPIGRVTFSGGVVDAVSWTPVPEPASAALLAVGLAALAARRR